MNDYSLAHSASKVWLSRSQNDGSEVDIFCVHMPLYMYFNLFKHLILRHNRSTLISLKKANIIMYMYTIAM